MELWLRLSRWTRAYLYRLLAPDFGADHYPLSISTHIRYPDDRHDGLPNQPRGAYADDFLAGTPSSYGPNVPLAGFPRRSIMIYKHGWHMPTPPRLPVYD